MDLPRLPLIIHWGQTDFRIQAAPAQPSIFEMVAAPSAKCLEYLSEDMIRIKPGPECASILFDFANAAEPSPSAANSITIDRIDARMRGNVQSEDLLISIDGHDPEAPESSQVFIFRGLDVIWIESDPKVVSHTMRNRVHLDVAEVGVPMLLFKGGKINETQMLSALPQLGEKYNRKFVEFDSFIYENKETVGEKWNWEHVRKLVNQYNITDFRDEPLLYLEDMLITKKGIGLKLMPWRKSKARKKTIHLFFPWKDFVNLKPETYQDERQLKLTTPQKETFVFNGTAFYSNVELIQFLKELRSLVFSHMQPMAEAPAAGRESKMK